MNPGSPRSPSVVAVVAIFVVVFALRVSTSAADGLLVTVGEVTSTAAVVWARGESSKQVSVEATAAGAPAITATIPFDDGRDHTGTATLTRLTPATRYTYRVSGAHETVTGEFVTAPAPDDSRRVKFLWSGDLGGGGYCRRVDGGYPIFRAMAKERPDFFLFVGDTIYADVPCDRPGTVPGAAFVARTLAEFHAKHKYNRDDPATQAFLRTTGVFAIWDDHEVTNDFSGPAEPLMPIGRQAFIDYWPIVAPTGEPNRLYRRVRWGRLLEVFILDTRQYRGPNSAPDGPGKTMLGAAQRQWLVDGLASSTAVWKVVVSSIPMSVPTGRRERHDSWSNANAAGVPEENGTGFAVERDAILRALRSRGVTNLVVLAADVHFAQLIRHHPTPEWSFHEFIAGPLSASLGKPRALDQALNPRSLFAHGGVNTFGDIVIDQASLTVRLVTEDGATLFTHTIGPE